MRPNPRIRLRWWPHTRDTTVASYRLRCCQIVEQLSRNGVDAALYDPADTTSPVEVLVLSKRYDAASLEHALQLRSRRGTRVVLDLCDNHFYAADPSPKWVERSDRLRAATRAADLVVASTEALAEVICAEAGSAVRIAVIGDAAEPPLEADSRSRWRHPLHEWHLHHTLRRLARQPGCHLVWFGHHGSDYASGGMLDLAKLQDALEALHQRAAISLTVISNNRSKFKTLTRDWQIPTFYIEWSSSTFSRALRSHQVALIPISRNPFTVCKTNNRLATALLHGLGVAADSIPSYQPFADACVLDNWTEQLERLVGDTLWRSQLNARGLAYLAQHWQLHQIAGQWHEQLSSLCGQSGREPG